MRKILTVILALSLGAATASGQHPDVAGILSRLGSCRITADYSITVDNGAPVIYSGTATAQDNCFRISGNGLEIYCDGITLTVADPASREAYVEDAPSLEDYINSNIGSVTDICISNTLYEAKSDDPGKFSFSAGPDWIVTDLR